MATHRNCKRSPGSKDGGSKFLPDVSKDKIGLTHPNRLNPKRNVDYFITLYHLKLISCIVVTYYPTKTELNQSTYCFIAQGDAKHQHIIIYIINGSKGKTTALERKNEISKDT